MSNRRGNDGMKVLVGVAIGAAIGAALAYFSDTQKRNDFIDDVTDKTARVRDDIKDAYYESKIRARKAKRDLSRYMSDMADEAGHFYDDAMAKAKRFGRKGVDAAEEVIELTRDDLEDLKEQAKEEAEKLVGKKG